MSIAARRSHRGDEYQLKIAVNWLIRLLMENEINWVQIDSVALPGDSKVVYVDDVVISLTDGTFKYIQAKVHQPDRKNWSINDISDELRKACHQLEQDPAGIVIFYSHTPFGDFEKLVEDAQNWNNYNGFVHQASANLRESLKAIANIAERSEETIYNLCARIEVASHHSLEDWNRENRKDIERIIPDPDKAILVLEQIARKNQAGIGATAQISRADVESELRKHGIIRAPYKTEVEIVGYFKKASNIGRYDLPRLIAGKKLSRKEVEHVIQALESGEKSILLTDQPGSGKSWILLEVADVLESNDQWALLFIKGDRFDDIKSNQELQSQLGLHDDVDGLAARLASYRKVCVIIDSLDALSLSRDQKALKVFLSLLDRLLIINNVSLIVACRDFDLSYDPLLRDRKWDKKIAISGLDFESIVAPILKEWDIDSSSISENQRKLLGVPRNLKLLERMVHKVSIGSLTSTYHFLDAFLTEAVIKDQNLGKDAIAALTDMAATLLNNRSLFMYRDSFKGSDNIYRRLISTDVLQADLQRNRLAFSHQTLLDTLITRNALSKSQTLKEFILSHPPLPFIRPSVRAFLFYLRANVPEQFSKQIKQAIGSDQIAYHLRRLVAESLAEITPTSDDLPLFQWILQNQIDLFRRFLWTIKGEEWFVLLNQELYPKLLTDPAFKSVQIDAIMKLREWMNDRPKETLALWKGIITDDLQSIQQIIFTLKDFKHWEIDGAKDLLETILALLKKKQLTSGYRFVGESISAYVEQNNNGDELLWNFMTANVAGTRLDYNFFHHDKDGLLCAHYDFHGKDFLEKRLYQSEYLLNQCLNAVENWSRQYAELRDENIFRSSFLRDTSWAFAHNRYDHHPVTPIFELLKAIESAIKAHSKNNDIWWQNDEPKLRKSNEAAIVYILIQSYALNIEANAFRISEFLVKNDIFAERQLDDELAELIASAFPYFATDYQEHIQQRITSQLFRDDETNEEKKWTRYRIYKYISGIPAIYRLPKIDDMVGYGKKEFGECPLPPHIFSGGGRVKSPITVQEMLALSDSSIERLIKFFDQSIKRRSALEDLVGGTDSIVATFRDCCAANPNRFLSVLDRVYSENYLKGYAIAVIEGVTTHLRYRFGNLQPPSEWKPVEPLPNGVELSLFLLKSLTKHADLWESGHTVAHALNICCHILDDSMDLEWLLLFLHRIARHENPEELKQVVFHDTKKGIANEDIAHISLNSVRGIVAEGAIVLASRLLEKGEKLPELLIPLLYRLAHDPIDAVPASLLQYLPAVAYYDPSLGWDIFEIAIKDRQLLWPSAERFLYYQYHDHFQKVKPFLDRMKVEIEGAGESWGRISTLAYLAGHISENELFNDLTELNNKEAWLGAKQVFSANLESVQSKDKCERGLVRLLDQPQLDIAILERLDSVFQHVSTTNSESALKIAESYIKAFHSAEKLSQRFWFFDWIAKLSENAPLAALHICEIFLDKVEHLPYLQVWHGEGLISAAIRILREADESDNQSLIVRAIRLQDRLLKINLGNISEVLDKASRP